MAKAKAKTVADTFEALIEIKYGRGKKAHRVKVPVTLRFADVFLPDWVSESEGLKDEALDKLWDTKTTVLNFKELKAAYKAWTNEG